MLGRRVLQEEICPVCGGDWTVLPDDDERHVHLTLHAVASGDLSMYPKARERIEKALELEIPKAA